MKFLKSLLVALGITIGGCGFEYEVEQELRKQGFTQEQAEVGAAVSLRKIFSDEKKGKDGKVTYEPNYGGIKDEDILEEVEKTHKGLEEVLGFKGIRWEKYKKVTGMGDHLRKQEKVFRYHRDRLQDKVLQRKFSKLVRPTRSYGFYGGYGSYGGTAGKVKPAERYSLADLFPGGKKPDFDADYVKAARKRGDVSGRNAVESLKTFKSFLVKVPNPKHYTDKGEPTHRLEKRKAGLKVTAYDLDRDKERKPDYIEVHRLKPDGKPESKPAVKVFRSHGSDTLDVVVADSDIEGTPGYGSPDYVGRVFGIGATEALANNTKLRDLMFRRASKLLKPDVPKMDGVNKIYVAKAGTVDMNPYQIRKSGWESFLPDYKITMDKRPTSNRAYVKQKKKDDDSAIKRRPLEWIAIRYFVPSRVVEFYRPRKAFRDKEYHVSVIGDRISLTGKDGKVNTYSLKAVIESKPYRIDFDRNDQKRWEIVDRDGDRKRYEAKREYARPSFLKIK